MADSKRISASVTVPASLKEDVFADEVRRALVAAGVVCHALSVTRSSATVLVAFGDALVPSGQADATTKTQISNAVNALSLAGNSLTCGVTSSLTVTFVAGPVPDDTFSSTKGGSGRPPW